MSEYDFTQNMSPEQIKRAKAAGRIVQKRAKGTTLYEDIEVGDVLLNGRQVAMNVASANRPQGRRYADAFVAWKQQFGLEPKDAPNSLRQYHDECIVCAANRSIAEAIIAQLTPGQLAGMGISGLGKRVRKEMKEETESDGDDAKNEEEEKEKERRRKMDAGLVLDVLKRHGLAILIEGENSELIVNDEGKFAAWASARPHRRPTLTIEGEVTDADFEDANED